MAYPTTFRYTKEHQWIDVKGDVATVGLTDYAQSQLNESERSTTGFSNTHAHLRASTFVTMRRFLRTA